MKSGPPQPSIDLESDDEQHLANEKNILIDRFHSRKTQIAIVISTLLFSAAHIGQGTAPLHTFILGLALGYLYYKTHRILPCIVAHMVFNMFGVLMFYLELWVKSPT